MKNQQLEILKSRNETQRIRSTGLNDSALNPNARDSEKTLDMKRTHTRILNKVKRKINLDKTVLNWKETGKNKCCNWLQLISRIDDVKLQAVCGTDVALYIIWLRYAAYYFGTLAVTNLAVMWVYLGGEPNEYDDFNLEKNADQSML